MTTRAERLDALEAATKQYAEKARKRLQNQEALAKRLLKGRTGPEHVNDNVVTAASALLVDEITQFLQD